MARRIAIVIGLVLVIAFSSVECSTDALSPNIEVTVVQNFTDYLQVEFLEPLITEPLADGPSPRFGITYILGSRILGDSLQATDSNQASYGTPQDVQISLRYPKFGVGAVITYIQIDVEQSTNLAQAYVTAGGIGSRFISVVVEARQTLYFRYKASIYGYY